MPVTARQRQVFQFIRRFTDVNKQPPTIAEIGNQFSMSSPASVHSILSALEREGLIKRIPNVSRGIEVIEQDDPENEYEVPLLGAVAAGQPIEAILTHDAVSVPRDMTAGGGRTFGRSRIRDRRRARASPRIRVRGFHLPARERLRGSR